MAKDKPLCCTIGYETKDGATWKANILAYSVEDAVKYLGQIVTSVSRINTTEGSKGIDAFHPQVRKDYLTQNVVEEREVEVEVEVIKEVPVEIIKEVFVESDKESEGVVCPWCEKKFKTTSRLKIHCMKFHLKDEE